MTAFKLVLNPNLYVRDPQETELGRTIVQEAIHLIDRLGIESFTFRKLAGHINSTEASIYRYFENKHKLLVYIIAWYWNWLEYRIDFCTQNIENPSLKMKKVLGLVCSEKQSDPYFPQIDEVVLSRIVIRESDKTYLTRQVDEENREGLFLGYKSLCKKIASIVQEINPGYAHAHSLVSTMLQMAHQQLFFAEHLPSLTDIRPDRGSPEFQNEQFLSDLIFKTITRHEQ